MGLHIKIKEGGLITWNISKQMASNMPQNQ